MVETREHPFAIELAGITHGYDGKTVLRDLSIRVKKGELVTLVGPSGCGKSTLLRILLGAEKPDAGKTVIDGKEKTRPDRDCGIVYQRYSVFPHLTVLENITFGLIVAESGMSERIASFFLDGIARKPLLAFSRKHREYLDRAREYLKKVDLNEAEEKYPHQLSGGMQQRVSIAQALIMKPKVLLLDEPFSALDPWTREQLQFHLIELWQSEKMTLIFITHDLEEAVFLGTRLLVLSPYWETTEGRGKGSRFVADIAVPSALEFKSMPDFRESQVIGQIVSRVRQIGFDKRTNGNLIPVEDFILEHPDSEKPAPAPQVPKN